MNFFNIFKKQVGTAVTEAKARTSYLLGTSTSTAISSDNAQELSSVFSCVNIKANALAVIPIKVYEESEKGRVESKKASIYSLLRYAPNDDLVASLYKKMISQDIDLRGNHYSQIVRNGKGEITALYPLLADKMEVITNKSKKIYKYDGNLVPKEKILHLFDIPDVTGHKGLSRIEYHKSTLEFAQNTANHGNELFKNSATPSGTYEMAGELSDEAFERLQESLEKKYSGGSNAGRPMLLEGGLTFKPLSIKNSDAEWLASRKFNREEICAIFGVPSSMINDTANVAYGNLEQKYLEFYSGTVFPLTTILEETFRLSLLTPAQKQNHIIKFKYNTMLRVDANTRAQYYQTRFNTGSMTPNEIREYEDENAYEGGDECYLQLNLATVKNLNKGLENG